MPRVSVVYKVQLCNDRPFFKKSSGAATTLINGRSRKAKRVGSKRLVMSNNSISLHRVIKASPEKVYRAFTEPLAIAAWYPPYGFLCNVHEMDVREKGGFKMSFHNFTTGSSHQFSGTYELVKPNEALTVTEKFDQPDLPDIMTTKIELKKASVGTELKIEQHGFPAFIPAEMCYLGWQESLEKLIKLVEPEIPDK